MERAGEAAAACALQLRSGTAPVLVFAGPGNNGGDALVLARVLHKHGVPVALVFAGEASKLPTDAHAAYEKLIAAGMVIHRAVPAGHFSLVVDGLFGIGLSRPIEGEWAALIERINQFAGPVLALDLPSGLDADTGQIHGVAVRASHTATFIAGKPGLYTADGPDHCGTVSIHNLHLPAIASAGAVLSIDDFSAALQPRQRNSHKGSHGSLAVIGGASGMTGAALLAARAALKLGAGRVFVGLLDHLPVDYGQPELMLRDPADALAQASAGVIGPGLGVTTLAYELLCRAVSADFPLLIDADGLSLISTHPVLARNIARRSAPTLLTPHPAEAARLLGCTTEAVQTDRIDAALRLSRKFNATVALKGCGTVLTNPDGQWRINTTGNPGLASGGTGDVLAGMAGALLAQGWPPSAALCCAVHLHGAAADHCVAGGDGPVGLVASEVMAPARQLLNRWINERSEQRTANY
jgi:hydroxyethylthiazole kinase-like uncharacterized protein yjeF